MNVVIGDVMKRVKIIGLALAFCWFCICGSLVADAPRELKVHVAQANNDSPYAFVRAKFSPGELADPWAVRFFDNNGKEVPYFVWDSITWRVAREGRADWGHRYALLNHAAGDFAEAREARGQKISWTQKKLPDLGTKLDATEKSAAKGPDSVCAALYLLQYHVPAFGKQRLTMRLFAENQVQPKHQSWKGTSVEQHVTIKLRNLEFRGLPDGLTIALNGKEVIRHAGFQAGGQSDTSHVDPLKPFSVETTEGIMTKISITGQSKGRADGAMDWQCSYWLFPEGSFVALEGFSLTETAGYLGGQQKLNIWQTDGDFTQRHNPDWDKPWWLHQAGQNGFVATHLFHSTPLTIGFGNNPFAVNVEAQGKDPKVEIDGQNLALTWTHRLDDPAIARLMGPQVMRRPNEPPPKDQMQPRWQPKVDWLYRQYVCGFGDNAAAAESALRNALGAAAGWIDRPVSEEEIAALLVQMMPKIATRRESAEIGLLKIVPAALQDDASAIAEALRRARDPVERTDYYINEIQRHVAGGGKPSEGRKKAPDGSFHEGWTGNPCYHAALMPCYVRVLEHFGLLSDAKRKGYDEAIVRFADFTLDLLGGKPIDFEKLDSVFRSEWPSRIVPVIPLMLHANSIRPNENFVRAVKMMFHDLMQRVERNPHGYFPVWSWNPNAAPYDTVYNPVSYERGIAALWSEDQLKMVGREQAAKFVTAQARWFVFSGQLLDTLELDNPTAIRATPHGGHTELRNQIGIYLLDDFAFYRGLLASLVTWSVASCQVPEPVDDYGVGPYRSLELSNAGSSMLRWALDIRPGSSWQERKVEPHKDGFTLLAWNRKVRAKPSFKISAKDAGQKGDADVLQVDFGEPAFRLPAEFDIALAASKIVVKANKPAKITLDFGALRPEWPAGTKPALMRGADTIRDAIWSEKTIEWQAAPGEYELRIAK
jgi:hypothetical protein